MRVLESSIEAEIESLERRADELLSSNSFISCIEASGIYMLALNKLHAAMHDDSIEDSILYPHFKTDDGFCRDWYDKIISKMRKANQISNECKAAECNG